MPETQTQTTERIRSHRVMTVPELYDHLLLERAKIDQQIEALKPFMGETDLSAAERRVAAVGRRAAAAVQPSGPVLAGATLGIAAFIQSRLSKTEPISRGDLISGFAREKNIAIDDAKAKINASLKDLVGRGKITRGPEQGTFLLPKSHRRTTSGRTLGVAAFIQERLSKTRPISKQELVDQLVREKKIPIAEAREKIKASLKDLTRRGRAVRGSEQGSYLAPKS